MEFFETPIQGAYLIELEKRGDERGFFARFFCEREFAKQGLKSRFVQVNNSLSEDEGTLRGMHYQLEPASEAKLLRCLRGSVYDVVLDIRLESPTFGKSFAYELNEENRTMMYVPPGCAHGFLTIRPNTEVLYLVSSPYTPQLERGIRWNDPFFQIEWPQEPKLVSEKDSLHPDWDPAYHLSQEPIST